VTEYDPRVRRSRPSNPRALIARLREVESRLVQELKVDRVWIRTRLPAALKQCEIDETQLVAEWVEIASALIE